MASSVASYTPFPDLTGWRSSAAERGSTSSAVEVHDKHDDLSIDVLRGASQRLGIGDPGDLITAAWTIVLIHLLSQEDDIDVHICIYPSAHLHLCIPSSQRQHYTLLSLLSEIQQAKATSSETELEPIKADNVVCVDLSGNSKPRLDIDATLSFSAAISEHENYVSLSLKASPMVHNAYSARLHLAQVTACLQHICLEATPASPALSMRYYPVDLLAGDNSLPAPLLDDIVDLKQERFEHQMERVAAKYSSNVALDFRESLEAAPGDESAGNYLYTYEELDRRAHIVSSHIYKHLGNQIGAATKATPIVALCLEKSPFTYLAILAVLKAGAAWCPIDTDWPAARRKALLAKSGAQIILTAGDRVSSQISRSEMNIIRLDTLDYSHSATTKQSHPRPSSEDLAYLIWTSGTTGLPKAVGVQHKAAVQALRSLQRVIPHNGSDFRYLQFSAYNFDLMILDVFYTWGFGGTLCSGSRSLLLSKLVDLSNAFKATHTLLTPAVLAMTPRESIPSLQVVINGGEKLSQVVADTWSVDCCLLNLYGPAEATLIAMSRTVARNDAVKAPNIGRALSTTSCHSLNADGDIVLKGAVGQLVIGGHQCAMGYIGDDNKTREQFIEHSQLGRVYKTGDLVRQLWSGEFEYLGRSDDQIKVNGIRIELLEINNVMRSAMDQVKDSETLVIKAGQQEEEGVDNQLVNFSVVPLENSREDTSAIRTDEGAVRLARQLTRFAASNLPSYMVPSLFVVVSHFPRTSSAKIDREALRKELGKFDRLDWLEILADTAKGHVADADGSPKEAVIRSLLASLCGVDENAFGRHTPFPSLGLNSIKAITLSHRLMQAGISATVVDIIQCQTLASLAERVSRSTSSKVDRVRKAAAFLDEFDQQYREAVSLCLHRASSSSDVKSVLPVTPLQEALLSETMRDNSRYWLHRAYTLSPSIDVARLQHAIQTIVERVDILRTCFVHTSQLCLATAASDNVAFVQVVLNCFCVKSIVIEETAKAKAWDDAILEHVSSQLALVATGTKPPVGFLIVKSGKQVQLVAVLHHALYDQVTLAMMEDAIALCYEKGTKANFQMQPFSSALHQFFSCDDNEERQRYETWKALLTRYPKGHAVSFPNLSGRDDVSNITSTSRYHRKTRISLDRMGEVAMTLQTSIRPILQAAWAAVLCAHCDTNDVILGDSISARTTSIQNDHVAGPLLDTLPVPICIDSTYRSIITAIDDFHKQAVVNLPVPLRHIRELVAMPTEFPLFASVFVFDPPSSETGHDTGKRFFRHQRDFGLSVEHSVAVEVTVTEDGLLELGIVVKDSVMSPNYADIILAQWNSAIEQAMRQPESFPSEFSQEYFPDNLLSASRYEMSDSIKVASKTPVTAALSKWAIYTPQAVAIQFYSSLDQPATSVLTRTYRELEEESTRVSLVLRCMASSKSVVAVCLHRSVETYCCLLAILKAGMTYLPVDASLPVQRKNDLLKHSQAALVVWSTSTSWSLDHKADLNGLNAVDCASLLDAIPSPPHHHSPLDMSSPAYIIFTSGSTGKPKGCVLTHGNLSSAIEAFRQIYDSKAPNTLDKKTRFLARSVEAFDVALLEALLPLQVGGAIVTGPRNIILQDMALAMQVMQVTHAAVVPSLFYTKGRRIVPVDLPSLRALTIGGERVTRDVITAWASSNVPLLNAYGPSEACIGTSIARLSVQDSTSNIGAPFVGTQYLVMKTAKKGPRLALRGEAGELCIGGLQVGSYVDGSESASFFEWKGQRIYRTGDQVRLRKDDVAEYLGRTSNGQGGTQVKLRGVRIEMGEVDGVLSKASKVSRFCLTRVLGEPPYLVTFVGETASSLKEREELCTVASGPLNEEARRLKGIAREKLPLYMVPRQIVPMEVIPLSSISGKIDGKRLNEWYQRHASELLQLNGDSTQDNQRELTKAETVVKEEVQRLLAGNAYIGPMTDVFSLGLDSLNVISLSIALSKRRIHAEVAHIMAHSTVEEIARGASKQPSDLSHEQLDYTRQAQQASNLDILKSYPLLPLQESMITQTLSDGETGSRYINILRLAWMADSIDHKRLESSVEEALCSHQIYRTIFVEIEGRIVQAVLRDKPTWRLDEADFDSIAAHQISTTLDCVPPLRYCITQSKEVLLAIHHALYDGESLSDLLEEIEARYMGTSIAESHEFVHYVEEMSARIAESKLRAWRDVLKDAVVTPFPCLTGEKVSKRDLQVRLAVEHRPGIALSLIKERARQEKVTVQLFVVDAFARLYARYVGQEEVLFGLVLGGRTSSSTKVHGPCINTVPFLYQRKSKEGWKQLQSTYANALANQHVSLPGLARLLQVHVGLFNTLFSYLGTVKSSSLFQEVSSNLVTEYPLAVEVQEMPQSDQIELRAVFDPHYIPAEQAELFLRQLEHLLSANTSFSPKHSLFAIENEKPVIPGPDASFLAKFNRQVKAQPEAVALVFSHDFTLPNEETTYRQLDNTSSAMASELIKIQGSVVGVLLKQCTALYPLLVAIWKAGKVYLPLDPSLPSERLAYMVSVAKPACIISTKEDAIIAGKLGRSLCIEDLLRIQTTISKRETIVEMKEAAYIMFTSGSSGKPKGVQISHLALAAAIYSWSQILPYTRNSRMLQLASPGFDVFLIEVCMPLALGFSFASAAKEDLLNDLEVTFSKLQLTMADLPAVLAGTVRPDKIKGGQPLQWLMSGGDVIEDGVIEQWSKHGLINAWGPTETTIGNTLGFVNNKSSRSWVGKAYPTCSIYILDAAGTVITYRGCIGEIAVGGPQVADGYVGNKDLTKEKFIKLTDGTRVYRTGDRGRLLFDGSLECLGRMDSGQVKINSQRVELREIELQLKRHSGITDAAVLYLKHTEMQSKQLVAFVVVEGGGDDGGEMEFRQDEEAKQVVIACLEEVKGGLASYMLPTICLVVAGSRLPLTPNNKIDTKHIQAVYSGMTPKKIRQLDARFHRGKDKREWTELEKDLQRIIADFCKLDKTEVSQDDSFYRLGIDSISGFRLLKRLREQGYTGLSLRDILQSPSVGLLSSTIERQARDQHNGIASAVEELDFEYRRRYDTSTLCLNASDQIKRLLPCTPLQEGLLLESLSSGLYVHHHFFKVEEGSLQLVMDAVMAVVKSYDTLRTSFHLIDGHFVQAVHTNAPLQIADVVETKDVKQAIMDIISAKHFAQEADLAKPLFSVTRFRSVGERLTLVGFCLHHALYDGETLEILFEEIEARARGCQISPRLEFEHLLPHLLSRREDERFIVDQVKDCWSTLFDRKGASSSSSLARACHYNERLLDIQMEALGQFASQAGVSMHIVALYAFVKLLSHLTGQRDVIFAQLFSLRDAISGAEQVVGPALNSVLTRVTLPDGETAQTALTRMQANNDATREHRRASMVQVLRLSRKARGGESIEFDSLFDFQVGRAETASEDKEKLMTPWEVQQDTTSQYALNIQFRQQGNSVSIVAVGDSRIFSRSELDQHMDTLEELLHLTMADCSQNSTAMPSRLCDLNDLPFTSAKGSRGAANSTAHTLKTTVQDLSKEAEVVLTVVAELLQMKKEEVDIATPINQYGIDSIMAIQLTSRLRAKGVVVGVADVLQGKTVEGISQRVAGKKAKGGRAIQPSNGHGSNGDMDDVEEACRSLGIPPREIEAVLPLLPGQAFEMAEYIKSKGTSGIFTFVYKIKEEAVDEVRMKKAWERLCASHSILRTCFVMCGGKARQVILANINDTTSSLQCRCLNGTISDLLEDRVSWITWLQESCTIDANLSQSPRAACLVSASDGCFLVLRLHHSLYDASTVNIVMQRLWRLYNQSERIVAAGSSDDYVGLVQHLVSEKVHLSSKAEAYWKDLLKDVSDCIIGAQLLSAPSVTATLIIPAILKSAPMVEKQLRRQAMSLGTAFIAAWSKCLLDSFPTHGEVVFGLYHRGRSSDFEGVDTMAYNGMNALPLVVRRERSTSTADLCHSIKEQLDDQTYHESTTSIIDILGFTKRSSASWNTYLNLVWDAGVGQQQDDLSQYLDPVAIPEYEQEGAALLDCDSVWKTANLGDMRSDVNVNLYWDRRQDCIDAAVRYRCDMVSIQEVEKMVTDMVRHFEAFVL